MVEWKNINFAEKDSKKYWHFYDEKLSIAKKLGFNFVSEAICYLYYDCQYSSRDIGDLFGVSYNCIPYRLKSWGLTMRRQGGATHFTGTYPIIKELEELEKTWQGTRKKLYKYIAANHNITEGTAKHFYRRRTWLNLRQPKN